MRIVIRAATDRVVANVAPGPERTHPDGPPLPMVRNSVARVRPRNAVEALVRLSADAAPPGDAAAAPEEPASTETTEELLRRYRRSGSRALLARVVERHRATVEAMATALALRLPPSVDARDLVHAGLWGLMQAIANYEPARCDQFQAFMRIRVRGAMLDELRHLDFLPRLFRRRVRERNETRSRLRMELEREPTDSELAAALGITEAALLRRCEPTLLRAVVPGDEPGEDRCEQLADDAVESPIEAITRRELIEHIRSSLDPTEWKVLQLHYLEGLNGKQVARRLRLSASRICQIHGRVLDRLKARLSPAAV
jgi:RNA polymerase sigma factor for flagellar operon FliA